MIRDCDIRRTLRAKLLQDHQEDPDVLIMDELPVCYGQTRIDIALINSVIAGYEIKSEADTLNRLPAQVESYNRAFEFLTIVTADSHLSKVREIVPRWWGISIAGMSEDGESVKITTLREPNSNPLIQGEALLQFLWRNELLELIKIKALSPKLRRLEKLKLFNEIPAFVPLECILDFVRTSLKSRDNWRV